MSYKFNILSNTLTTPFTYIGQKSKFAWGPTSCYDSGENDINFRDLTLKTSRSKIILNYHQTQKLKLSGYSKFFFFFFFLQYFNTGKIRNTNLKRAVEVEIIDGEFCCGSSSHEHYSVYASFCSCPFPDPIKEVEEAGGKSGSQETTPTKTCKRTRDFSGLRYHSSIFLNYFMFEMHFLVYNPAVKLVFV